MENSHSLRDPSAESGLDKSTGDLENNDSQIVPSAESDLEKSTGDLGNNDNIIENLDKSGDEESGDEQREVKRIKLDKETLSNSEEQISEKNELQQSQLVNKTPNIIFLGNEKELDIDQVTAIPDETPH